MTRTALCCLALLASVAASGAKPLQPNVLLVITDDQGHGDLGFHGNPIIKTPHLDAFAKQSVRLTHFHVNPVCSPTRASLLTGRYCYRTGVVDTFIGRSLMHPDEVTLAEMLGGAGYRTGIFGKWHLGDNYPLRAIDQGFQEALLLRGGGLAQPSDPPGENSYFDALLQHNGKPLRTKGYCSDVFTDAALQFVAADKERPFFCYVAYNAPHGPYQVPDNYHALYKGLNLAHDQFPKIGQPLTGKANEVDIARAYGMITNIDDNFGRLLAKLEELKLAEDTIVWFLTDNGPPMVRYNSGMRGRKGTVYDGGIRVPSFVRWPRSLKGGREVETIAAHIDVTPTLLAACGVEKPKGAGLDGRSLLPLLKQEKGEWTPRTLYFQWHRGDVPELNRACAARADRWKLVQSAGVPPNAKLPENPTFQLFDMLKDPNEEHDVASKHADVVAEMRKGYETWFADVKATRNFAPPRIHVGTAHESPTVLTRQDWRGPRAGWTPKDLGHWDVEIAAEGSYDVTTRFPAVKGETTVTLTVGEVVVKVRVADGVKAHRFTAVPLKRGPAKVEAALGEDKEPAGAHYVEIERRE